MRNPARHPSSLWRCPKCGHRFVTRNIWHSCGRYPLADHFAGRPPVLRQTFRRWLATARRCGPVTVYAQKTRIVIQARVRFAGAVVRKDWLDAGLWLKRRVVHPRVCRIESFGRLGYGIHFRLTKPSEIDPDLATLVREAYAAARLNSTVTTRRATAKDAKAIALAHLDSIRSIGPAFYPPDVVKAWGARLTPAIYVRAMADGEAFFVATGDRDGRTVVLGFSTHRVDDDQDGVSVYVRGSAARRGIGTALLRLAEEHARARGAKTIQIEASLAGVEFYKANGFQETRRGEARLMSGRAMPCVFMRKTLK